MKKHWLWLIGLFFAFLANTSAQDIHVSSKYLKDSKETVVASEPMFIVNTNDWRMTVEFRFYHPKQKLMKLPKSIQISLHSLAKEVKYPRVNDQKVSLIADGEQTNLEILGYLATNWVFEKDRLVGNTLRDFQVKNGKVFDESGKPISGNIEESLTSKITQQKLLRLAKAQSIEIRVGSDVYRVTPNQVNTIRSFAEMTIPQ